MAHDVGQRAARAAGPWEADDREAEARAALAKARRVVVKIGTNTIARQKGGAGALPGAAAQSAHDRGRGGIDVDYVHRVAAELAALVREGREVILVTSGAIGMGARELGLARRPTELSMRQACAAVGQPILMDVYRSAFGAHGFAAAQVLVTRDDWDNRSAYLNLRTAVERLLGLGVVPVFNENDTVSTAEIGNAFGDNDRLSAYVASKIDAEVLIMLSDVDSLYDADPREDPAARPIPYVRTLDAGLVAAAGGKGSEFSTGGMKTKLQAVSIARDAGCRVLIAHGREERVIPRILSGERLGTLFDADGALPNRRRWLKNSQVSGSLAIDEGAMAAIRARKSLLTAGLLAVEGSFARGAVLGVNGEAKLVSTYSSTELRDFLCAAEAEMEGDGPGPGKPRQGRTGKIIARPEEIVFTGED